MTDRTNTTDEAYMRRAIQLALLGEGETSPNPMVGAVIVARGRIIGEGWHRKVGQGHAEVNAIASVADSDRHLLPEATVYVTLEPCSHYGKTPPCSKLLIDNRVCRVVVGSRDPFPKVAGRGIAMLREAGIEVDCGVLEQECRAINPKFMTAHTLGRPYITLKWAQSADGFMAPLDADGKPCRKAISNQLTMTLMHRERSLHDAIMVGTGTVIADDPSLSVRLWPGRDPRPVTFDRCGRLPQDCKLRGNPQCIIIRQREPLGDLMKRLYSDYGITSLLVEGGAELLHSFLDNGLYDEIRREKSPQTFGTGLAAPTLSTGLRPVETASFRGSQIERFAR